MTKVCNKCGMETEGLGQEVCRDCEGANDTKDKPPAPLCSAYGKEKTTDRTVCLQCEESVLAASKSQHCRNCKIELQPNARFCHSCDSPPSADEPVTTKHPGADSHVRSISKENDEYLAKSTSKYDSVLPSTNERPIVNNGITQTRVNTNQSTGVSTSEGTSVDPADDDKHTTHTKEGCHKGGSKVKSDDRTKSSATSRNMNERKLRIKFHVLVSKDFNITEKDEVIMVIGDEHYGGWNPERHQWNRLKLTGDRNTYSVMEIDQEFDIAMRTVTYKYAVVRKDKLKTKFEKYITQECQEEHHNRYLDLQTLQTETDCFNVTHCQYDGFVVPKEDTKMKKLWTHVKTMWGGDKGLAHIFMEEFCDPYIGNNEWSVHQIIHHFKRVLSCLTKVYVDDWHYWPDRHTMTNEIMQPILSRILSEKTAGPENRIQNACLVILLSQQFNTPLCSEDNAILCKAFKASPNSKKDGCIEFDIVKGAFGTKELKSIKDGLIAAMCNSVRTKKDPSWLYGLAMYHFITDRCTPYEALKKDITHDSSLSTKWWGIDGSIYNIVDLFKKQYGTWSIALQSVLDELSPIFTMDYLLPRSIMASLCVEEIKEAILSHKIPFDVCCANLIYFLKALAITEYDPLHTCLENIGKNMKTYMEQPYRSSKVHGWMTYKIAGYMLSQCKTIRTLVVSVHIALQTISDYSIKRENDKEGKHEPSSDTVNDYHSLVRRAIDHIKSSIHFYRNFSIEEIFQWWNELSIVDLPCKTFQEKWMCTLKTELTNLMNDQAPNLHKRSTNVTLEWANNLRQ